MNIVAVPHPPQLLAINIDRPTARLTSMASPATSLRSLTHKSHNQLQCSARQCASLHRARRKLSSRVVPNSQTPTAAQGVAKEQHQTVEKDTVWQTFAANVSGEWEGVTATFTPAGEPEQLPERYVPEAFREWGVELWDWQSQCSSTASTEGIRQLRSTVRRLMPTVGCEADAIAFTEEHTASSSSSSSCEGAVLVVQADGSYNIGPGQWPGNESVTQVQLEHCFMLPATSQPQQQQPKFRVKVVQNFKRSWKDGRPWLLASVDLHREKFDGPYTGRRELAGCGGGQPGIAQQPRLQQQQLAGAWTPAPEATTDAQHQLLVLDTSNGSRCDVTVGAASCLNATGLADEGVVVTLLPSGAWSAVVISSDGQVQHAEAGVVLQQNDGGIDNNGSSEGGSRNRFVSVRRYSSGELSEVALATQQKELGS